MLGDMMLGVVLFVLLFFSIIFVLGFLGLYKLFNRGGRRPEKDVATEPSVWCVDTRAVANGMQTEYGIVRVSDRSGDVLERRVMGRIRNDVTDYTAQLDAAQDRAYEAMRVANVGLRRR